MKFGKRTIFWLIPLGMLGLFVYFYGPKDDITANPYIDEMKQQSVSIKNEATIGEALDHSCTKGKWVFFKTQREQAVVEFKGTCEEQSVNLQFLVGDNNNHQLGALLLDNVQQTSEKRTQFIEQLYSNL